MNRRHFIGGSVFGAAAVLTGCGSSSSVSTSTTSSTARAVPKVPRAAGSLPRPNLPAGTDQVPKIEHIVVVMMENHSFDNILGIIGRGDGFTLGRQWPADGQEPRRPGQRRPRLPHAHRMPDKGVRNDWTAAHEAYDGGTCQGFVTSSTAEAMGYFTREDLPFTCGMAGTFPIADRYFCSVMAQTDPNRRYLISGTSLGLIDDTFPSALPPNGVIFQQFNNHGITWKDYYSDAAHPRDVPAPARRATP